MPGLRAAAPARPGSRSAQRAGPWRHAGHGDLRIHVHAQMGLAATALAQHVGEQAQPAAQVQHGLPVARQVQHAVIQRVAAQLAAGVAVVAAAGPGVCGRNASAIARARRSRCGGQGLAVPWRAIHRVSPFRRAGGRRPAARARSTARIRAEGCRPSSAIIAGSPPWSRLMSVMSTKATPCWVQITSAAALNSSVSISIAARSRPLPIPNGVAPQSGKDSTSTRPGRPPAKPIARCSRAWNCTRYSSSGRPRYWLLTPISRLTKSNGPCGTAASMRRPARRWSSRWWRWSAGRPAPHPAHAGRRPAGGQRPSTATASPMVYESPSAR